MGHNRFAVVPRKIQLVPIFTSDGRKWKGMEMEMEIYGWKSMDGFVQVESWERAK